MQVLKFGGSSVSNAENINKMVEIIQKIRNKDKTIVVVSALGGTTDALINSVVLASQGDEEYKEKLHEIEKRHLEAVKQLLPVAHQSSILSLVKKSCNEMEDICNGVFLLQEISSRTKDRMMSYGELLSSQIISARLNAAGAENVWVDSRRVIR